MAQRIGVAMSGGVDSSVAACLLSEAGESLVGLTMRLFPPCGGKDGVTDAQAVAARLGFPHRVLDLEEAFRNRVMDPFVAAYEEGQTPNPCVLCNRDLKFGVLLDRALALGLDAVATGHYARVERDRGTGQYRLKKAVHPEKDQSYFLYALNQAQLARIRFPLGALSKPEIRSMAEQRGLCNARRGDSQDICFVPDGDYEAFLRAYTGRDYPPGPFLDQEGNTLGMHRGLIAYTVGQRRGLAVSSDRRLYVKQVCPHTNAVILAGGEALYARTLTAHSVHLSATDRLDGPVRVMARIRSRHGEEPAVAEQTGADALRVTFDRPQRAIAPGQSVVLYDGDTVIGGGVIDGAQ